MPYNKFRREIISKEGADYSARLEQFFAKATKAVKLANYGRHDEALKVGSDALVFAKYSDAGYAILHLLGMLCQSYVDNHRPDMAESLFKHGMKMIEDGESENKDTYQDDINSFLDLKIRIDNELRKKNSN